MYVSVYLYNILLTSIAHSHYSIKKQKMAGSNDATKQQKLKMAETSAPNRMKTSQQIASMFVPKLMFFLTSSTKDDMKNWADCFDMKAGAVYFTIFGQNANENTLNDARNLLKAIAYFITRGELIAFSFFFSFV